MTVEIVEWVVWIRTDPPLLVMGMVGHTAANHKEAIAGVHLVVPTTVTVAAHYHPLPRAITLLTTTATTSHPTFEEIERGTIATTMQTLLLLISPHHPQGGPLRIVCPSGAQHPHLSLCLHARLVRLVLLLAPKAVLALLGLCPSRRLHLLASLLNIVCQLGVLLSQGSLLYKVAVSRGIKEIHGPTGVGLATAIVRTTALAVTNVVVVGGDETTTETETDTMAEGVVIITMTVVATTTSQTLTTGAAEDAASRTRERTLAWIASGILILGRLLAIVRICRREWTRTAQSRLEHIDQRRQRSHTDLCHPGKDKGLDQDSEQDLQQEQDQDSPQALSLPSPRRRSHTRPHQSHPVSHPHGT
jgi:hypothetical protein